MSINISHPLSMSLTRRRWALAALAIGAAAIAGCSSPSHEETKYDPLPQRIESPTYPAPLPETVDTDTQTVRACASFSTVSNIAQRSTGPGHNPDFAPPVASRRALADALSFTTQKLDVPRSLQSALDAYAYSLRALDNLTFQKAPKPALEAVQQIIINNESVVKAICREPSSSSGTFGSGAVADQPGESIGRGIDESSGAEAPRRDR
ncbi:hypothetical protein [Mycobacteroides abscessus]|uniref:hypothetical protein n=1 Tax=Mycobacteroides abscessus TaxID=36809 RepID=UPI000927945B|nr:hypothetical protein [Mycobacteroides abscessus]MDO2986883.1 hypothetical protein [Mycobacteroides abscessus subsp. abscessus]MDO3208839.1 hypothetical protein [Mycobacteroides abscessus subsp. massiliense]RIS64291.1 hypothetical protein D2E70_25840 [Mycobacteroides abscessus]SIA25803.1 Uncharacterised protein [Mycobacteroides abscessus subsp. abscessus]SID34390.1 Uncharacterised protein [Mycobacteroides abscessus subsp. abscessus]